MISCLMLNRKTSELFLLKILGLSLFVIMLTNCRNIGDQDEQLFREKLALADSLSHFQPDMADSIYRWLIRNSPAERPALQTRALLGVASGFTNQGQYDSARVYFEMAFRQATEAEDTLGILRWYLQSGNHYLDPGNFDKAETEFTKGLNYAETVGNQAYKEKFLLSLGTVRIEQGDYTGAIKVFMLGLKMAEAQKNLVSEAFAAGEIGRAFSRTKDFDDAIRYQRREIELRQSLNMARELAGALQNLGIIFRRAGMPDSALVYYQKSLGIYARLGDSANIVMVRYNMGIILKNEQKYPLAKRELMDVLSSSRRLKIIQGQMYANNALADIFLKTGQTQLALSCIDSSIMLAGQIGQRSNLPAYFEQKTEILVKSGDYKSAYEQVKLARSLSDSLLSEEKQKEIARLKMAFDTKKKEAEIKYLQVDNQHKTTRLRMMTILLLSGLVILGLIFITVRYRMKRMRLQNELGEERHLRLQEEQKLEKSEREQLDLKSRMQEQELVYKTLVEADLTAMNRSVSEKLAPFRLKFSRKADQEEFARTIGELTRDSRHDPMAEFDLLFRELHPGFYENLLAEFPGLTPSELQICALIRLNFSSKDIARLVSLSVATVDSTRSHIRKKLNLEVKDNLSAFLMVR